MLRFATTLVLAALLAMGHEQPSAAQEKPATPESRRRKRRPGIWPFRSSPTVPIQKSQVWARG